MSPHARALPYRPDLDGLRAVSVLAVVAAHAGIPGVSGGFVGVDVFFVLSGFLIASIIERDLGQGEFKLRVFFARRAGRLLPALCVMLVGVAGLGLVLLPPWQLEAAGWSITAASAFVANLFLLSATDGYFGADAGAFPLLHTWSLSVEEQFYAVFPLLMLAMASWGRCARAAVISTLSIAGFIVAAHLAAQRDPGSFFLTEFRAWEFGVGIMLALWSPPAIRSRSVANAAGLTGLGLILGSVILIRPEMTFPGLLALPVVAGSALVIHAGQTPEGVVRDVLGTPVMRGIGLISYSLYLWHWPLLVMLESRMLGESTLPARIAVVLVAAALAWMSWRWIETPFRGRPEGRTATPTLLAAGAAAGCAAALGVGIGLSGGLPARVAPEVMASFEEAKSVSEVEMACRLGIKRGAEIPCLLGDPETTPSVLVWGDSHAAAWTPGIDAWLSDHGLSGSLKMVDGCPPIPGLVQPGYNKADACDRSNRSTLAFLEAHPEILTVVFAAHWPYYAHGTYIDGRVAPKMVVSLSGETKPNDPIQTIELGLRQVVEILKDRDVILLGSVPEVSWRVPERYVAARFLGRASPRVMDRALVLERIAPVDQMLASVARRHGATFLSAFNAMCNPGGCPTREGGALHYRDSNHMAPALAEDLGARLLSPTGTLPEQDDRALGDPFSTDHYEIMKGRR